PCGEPSTPSDTAAQRTVRPRCSVMVAAFITEPLVVDPVVHAAEIARFVAKVVEGPGEYCAIWTGAIGDDGYGRFSITREGRERTVKPHRYAVAYRLGVPIEFGEVIDTSCVTTRSVAGLTRSPRSVMSGLPPRPTICGGWRVGAGVAAAGGGCGAGLVCPDRNAPNAHVPWPPLSATVGTRRASGGF
ncbi:MAG: hypothetical protein ACRDR6_31195, partial [Pseudonocardiaceae bacterium]